MGGRRGRIINCANRKIAIELINEAIEHGAWKTEACKMNMNNLNKLKLRNNIYIFCVVENLKMPTYNKYAPLLKFLTP